MEALAEAEHQGDGNYKQEIEVRRQNLGLRIKDYELRITDYELRITDYSSLVTRHETIVRVNVLINKKITGGNHVKGY